jgi:2-keto-4-pentenoate hydratase/2-oxohepta-3-ene-1,7-dioic acid hydratase in catechol pathway
MLVTRDEILDANNLELSLKVGGVTYQQANTENMIFNVRQIVSYVSHFMRLDPGDVIATGTPAGVGLGQNPPVFLKEGDIVCASIQGLGEQRQRVTRAY